MSIVTIETHTAPPAVALSRDELWAVMRVLRAPWVPGIPPIDVDHPLPPEQAEAVDQAELALMARGMLSFAAPAANQDQPPQAVVPAPVIALVGACACSPFDLFLSLRRASEPRMAHFHQVGALGVAHTMPQPEIHYFEPLAERQGILDAAAEMLGLGSQTALPLTDGVIAAPKLRQVHQCPPGRSPATIAQILREGGLSAPLGDAVTRALQSAVSTGIILVAQPSAGPTEGAILGVIVAPDTCFTLSPDRDATRYIVRPSSAEAIRDWIVSQLPR